jgi:hypothetical protein
MNNKLKDEDSTTSSMLPSNLFTSTGENEEEENEDYDYEENNNDEDVKLSQEDAQLPKNYDKTTTEELIKKIMKITQDQVGKLRPTPPSKLTKITEYTRWAKQMKRYLNVLGLYECIQTQSPATDKLQDLCANKISTNISEAIYSVIQHCDTAHHMWFTLEKHCLGQVEPERHILKEKFKNLHLSSTSTMEEFLTDYRNLIQDMRSLGIEPSDFEQ